MFWILVVWSNFMRGNNDNNGLRFYFIYKWIFLFAKGSWKVRNETKVRIFVSTKTVKVMDTTSKRVHTEVTITRRNLVTQIYFFLNRNKHQQLLPFIAFILGDEIRYSQVGIEMLALLAGKRQEKKNIGNIRGVVRILSRCIFSSRGFYAGEKRGIESRGRKKIHRPEDVPSLKS